MSENSKNILIVEDDMILAMVLERMIIKLKYGVADKVLSGEQAVVSARELNPDLILMDIQLKDELDGIDAMHKIRSRSDVPVIYITGNSDEHNLQRARETNYVDYLVKPIRMSDLEESMSGVFDQK